MSLRDDIKSLFPEAKFTNDSYVRVKCPFHKGGLERHPSMSIIIKDGHNNMKAGDYVCFTCGARGTFSNLAEYFGLQYIPDNTYEVTEKDLKPQFKLTTQQAIYKKDVPYNYSPYLANRGISPEIQKKFRTYERTDEQKVYLPVFSKEGQFLFANARATDKKAFYLPKNISNSLAYIEEIDFGKPLAIVESQINALSLWTSEYCRAVATLGVTKINLLKAIKDATGPFLLMFDGDQYGQKATEQAKQYLGAYRCISYRFNPNEDVNDLWRNCNFNQDLFFDELDKRKV